jgi:hypothetical protein
MNGAAGIGWMGLELIERNAVDVFHDHQHLIAGSESGAESGDVGVIESGD